MTQIIQIIQLAIVAAVILFAVYRTFPDDHPLKKVAVLIVGALAAGWAQVWPLVQGLFGG